MRLVKSSPFFLLLLFFPLATSAFAMQDEGDIVSRAALLQQIPPNTDHPVARNVIAAQEEEISSQPAAKKILVVHYRAQPTAQYSMNDDRIVIALEQNGAYRILKVYESDAAVIDGKLYSEDDFDQDFISVRAQRFLHIRDHVSGSGGITMHDVYTISSDGKLSTIPFAENRSKLLKAGEELRNGQYLFVNGEFRYEAGIYVGSDPECCPSDGSFHATYELQGDFKQAPTGVFTPDFKFVVTKESRSAKQRTDDAPAPRATSYAALRFSRSRSTRLESSRFALSSSCRRVALRPRPARLMK